MTTLCRHELPVDSCATCTGAPRDRLQEALEEQVTHCKAEHCNTEIVWAETDRGRKMPVDVEPPADGSGNVELWLEGKTIRATVHGREGTGAGMRVAHFTTCADAEPFRKQRVFLRGAGR